jgi:hypothetical protein
VLVFLHTSDIYERHQSAIASQPISVTEENVSIFVLWLEYFHDAESQTTAACSKINARNEHNNLSLCENKIS